jgi:hypothetical protein
MFKSALQLSALLLASVVANAQVPATDGSFTVVDERPEADKKQKTYSLMITSCDYGVYRLADKKGPTRFDALHVDLAELRGAALAGKTLRVQRYDIHFNNAAWMRESVNSQFRGVIIDSLKSHGVGCPREKMKAGWFDPAELTAERAPLIVELTALLDDKPHDVRVVYTPTIAMWGRLTKPDELAEVRLAMRKAAEAFAATLAP